MDGYLLINKPAGISSFGVVAKVRRVLSEQVGHKVKVGHTGTLDPAAEGLMILVVGAHCKRAAEFSKLDKTYEVELELGSTSTTADSEGETVKISDLEPSKEATMAAIKKFQGRISQTPPIYSAVKVGGQRAYKLARAGKQVEIEPRQVSVYSIEGVQYDYPKVQFTTEVSSGTYIRSLVEDIGKELDVGAYLSSLKRTKIANYRLSGAIELDELNSKLIQSNLKMLPKQM